MTKHARMEPYRFTPEEFRQLNEYDDRVKQAFQDVCNRLSVTAVVHYTVADPEKVQTPEYFIGDVRTTVHIPGGKNPCNIAVQMGALANTAGSKVSALLSDTYVRWVNFWADQKQAWAVLIQRGEALDRLTDDALEAAKKLDEFNN